MIALVKKQEAAGEEKGEDLSIGSVVMDLYDNFNKCDARGTAACFTEDVVYEDLLLGSSTLIESRADFEDVIKSHPVFLTRRVCTGLRLDPPEFAIVVDNISEDLARGNLGVEWHVELNGEPLILGRGLSFFRVCSKTGKIRNAVDIAEAPWRAIGLVFAPFLRGFRAAFFPRRALALGAKPVRVEQIQRDFLGVVLAVFFLFIVADKNALDTIRDAIDEFDDLRDSLPF